MGSYYLPPTGSQIQQFETLGTIGKYYDPIYVDSSTTVDFTGSNYGYGAFVMQDATNVEITASNGLGMPGAAFNAKEIHEIGLSRIKIGSTGKVYAFKRQQ